MTDVARGGKSASPGSTPSGGASAPTAGVRALPPRRRRFVEEYVKDCNGTQAAIRAGYSPKTANEQAAQLLANLSVRQAVDALQAKLTEANNVTVARVIRELALLGFANMQDYIRVTPEGDAYVDLSRLTRERAAAIGELTSVEFLDGRGEGASQVRRTKLKLHGKVEALVKLGQRFKLFAEDGGQTPVAPIYNFYFEASGPPAKPVISSKPRRGGVELELPEWSTTNRGLSLPLQDRS